MKATLLVQSTSGESSHADTYLANVVEQTPYSIKLKCFHNGNPYYYQFDYHNGAWRSFDDDHETTITFNLEE